MLDGYVDKGDLFPAGTKEGVERYLVSGLVTVDIMDVSHVHPELFYLLAGEASEIIPFGTAGNVQAVTREGYFVLAIMIGTRGFARHKEDPMAKVRDAWDLFGARTDKEHVNRMLAELGSEITLDEALTSPES